MGPNWFLYLETLYPTLITPLELLQQSSVQPLSQQKLISTQNTMKTHTIWLHRVLAQQLALTLPDGPSLGNLPGQLPNMRDITYTSIVPIKIPHVVIFIVMRMMMMHGTARQLQLQIRQNTFSYNPTSMQRSYVEKLETLDLTRTQFIPPQHRHSWSSSKSNRSLRNSSRGYRNWCGRLWRPQGYKISYKKISATVAAAEEMR